jgi:hypothetical protein
MYLRLLYFSVFWIKIPDGYQIASLVELGLWSTSQLSLWNWSLRLMKNGVSFGCMQSLVISLVIIRYIRHCLLILPLIYSHMCDLTSWAHKWSVSSFVLKTGCYIYLVFYSQHSLCLCPKLNYCCRPPKSKPKPKLERRSKLEEFGLVENQTLFQNTDEVGSLLPT